MEKGLPDVADDLVRMAQADLAEQYDTFQARQQEFIQEFGRIDDGLADFEERAGQALLNQQAELTNQLEVFLNDYQKGRQKALVEASQRTSHRLGQLLSERDEQIKEFRELWSRQEHQRREQYILARKWLDTAYRACNFINLHYQQESTTPGELENLASRLSLAEQNLADQLPESALTIAQEVYLHLSELRLDYEQTQAEARLAWMVVYNRATRLKRMILDSEIIPLLDMQGITLPCHIKVDVWTNGELGFLLDEVNQSLIDLERKRKSYSSKQLTFLHEQTFPEMERRLNDAIYRARWEAVNAQLRMNIADMAIQALAHNRYMLEDAGFEKSDQRGAFVARLINYEGCQVVVRVDPLPESEGKTELHLYAHDPIQKTAHEKKQRAREILQVFREIGISTSDIVVEPEARAGQSQFHHLAEGDKQPMMKENSHIPAGRQIGTM